MGGKATRMGCASSKPKAVEAQAPPAAVEISDPHPEPVAPPTSEPKPSPAPAPEPPVAPAPTPELLAAAPEAVAAPARGWLESLGSSIADTYATLTLPRGGAPAAQASTVAEEAPADAAAEAAAPAAEGEAPIEDMPASALAEENTPSSENVPESKGSSSKVEGHGKAPTESGDMVVGLTVTAYAERSKSRSKLTRRRQHSGQVITRKDGAAVPTRATLLPDSKVKNFKPRSEWDAYNEEELDVLARVSQWLGEEEFVKVPQDLLSCFLRGYAYKPDWAETSFVELQENVEWRQVVAADSVLKSPPPNRSLFEQLNQGGPIGRDPHGHVVELVRLGRIEVSRLFKTFELDEIMKHIMYAAEAKRACNVANSYEQGKRLTKTVVVIDCAGLSTSHLQKNFVTLMKKTSEVLSGHYPETMFKTYVINGPLIVRAAWNLVRPMIHPITVAKFTILGSGWEKVFERDGIVLDGGEMPKSVSWTDSANAAIARHGAEVRAARTPPTASASQPSPTRNLQGPSVCLGLAGWELSRSPAPLIYPASAVAGALCARSPTVPISL